MESIRRIVALEKVGNPIFSFRDEIPVKYLSFIFGKFEPPLRSAKPAAVPVEISRLRRHRTPRAARDPVEEARAILERYERLVRPVSL